MTLSRIGKKSISLPQGVTLQIHEDSVTAKGAKGELSLPFEKKFVRIEEKDSIISVISLSTTHEGKARHGLYRSLLQNLFIGVSEGYEKSLELRGVGYKFVITGNKIDFSLGFSHPVIFDIPENVTAEAPKDQKNVLVLRSIDKQAVGQTAAKIRALRPPEPYKGKGVRYVGEYVRQKAGKKAGA
jgi:large subunit ribosomal protein L6